VVFDPARLCTARKGELCSTCMMRYTSRAFGSVAGTQRKEQGLDTVTVLPTTAHAEQTKQTEPLPESTMVQSMNQHQPGWRPE